MRWILDACSLISLVQSSIFDNFMSLVKNETVVIDTSVYSEVVTQGKKQGYEDAHTAENLLKQYHLPIIPNDVESSLHLFKDAGETSCYLLAQEEGIVMTFDRKAYNKFLRFHIPVMKVEMFFMREFKQGRLSQKAFLDILTNLQEVNAITTKTYFFYKEQIMKGKK